MEISGGLTEAHGALLGRLAGQPLGDSNLLNIEQSDLWSLLDSLPVAVLVSTDRDCRHILGNAAARVLYRLGPNQNFSLTGPGDELPPYCVYSEGKLADPAELPMQVAARTGRPVLNTECEVRFADGTKVFVAGNTIPIRDSSGEVCGSMGAFLDVTARKSEVELAELHAAEMAHRLKNTLAIVQAISSRTVRPLIGEEAYRSYENRLISLANFQKLVARRNWSEADLTDLVETMISAVAKAARERIATKGPALALPGDAAMVVSMVLHELATNACKYGSLSNASGYLQISWETIALADGQKVSLLWAESGGPPVKKGKGGGFGATLMRTVLKLLNNPVLDLDFEETGLRARLSFDLPAPRP